MTMPTAAPAAPSAAATANPQVTKHVLRALALVMAGQDVPTDLTSTTDRQRIKDIELQQIDATVSRLRSRYPTVVMSTRELFGATARATIWAKTLVPEGASQAYGHAWHALIASLARRIVIDGLRVARGSLEHCRAGLLELETRDDLWPLDESDQPTPPECW